MRPGTLAGIFRGTGRTVAKGAFSVLRRGASVSSRSDVGDFVVHSSGIDGRIGPVRGDEIPDMGVKVESWRIMKVTLYDYTDILAGDRIRYGSTDADVRYVNAPITGVRVATVCYVVVGKGA